MDTLLERLKQYEPFFGEWRIDFVAITYDDMAWVYFNESQSD